MQSVIAKIRKNGSEDIWVTLQDYRGKPRLDIRVFFRSADALQPTPTRKGISLDTGQIKELLASLRQFESNMSSTQVLPKSNRYDIRIYGGAFADRKLIHIRTFYLEEGASKPGHGVAFDPSLLSRVIEAVERAEQESSNASN
jgi:hypothetical protein